MITTLFRLLLPARSRHALHDRTRLRAIWKMVLLLSLALIAVQTSVHTHFVSHLAEEAHSEKDTPSASLVVPDDSQDDTVPCLDCLTLSSLSFPVPTSACAAPRTDSPPPPFTFAYATCVSHTALPPHCRAPPTAIPAIHSSVFSV